MIRLEVTAKSEAFGGRSVASPCPKPFGRFAEEVLSDRTGSAVPPQVPLSNWLLCYLRETRARLTNVGSRHLVVVPPVTSMSESPRKRRKESNQRTQGFLQSARLLDTCASGQKLLFLEHNWTVAYALKVITLSRPLAVRQAYRDACGELIRSLRVEKVFKRMFVSGTGTAPHIQRSASNQA